MTSEPDSKPGRRPPTIELKAKEVGQPDAAQSGATGPAATPASESPSSTSSGSPPRAASTTRLKTYAVGALIGAVAIVGIIALLRISGIVPSRQPSPLSVIAPVDEADITARLDKLERAIQTQRSEPGQSNRAAAEAQTKTLSDAVAALGRRVDAVAAVSQSAAKSADAAQTTAAAAKTASEQAGQSVTQAASDAASKVASEAAIQAAAQVASRAGVQKSDVDALANRIAALESAVKSLSENAAHPGEGANDQSARLTVAAEALRATVERGAPYQAELAAVQSLGVAQNAIAPLEAFAASGVPTTAALAHELATLAPDLPRATEPSSAGSTFLDRLKAHARDLVQITPVDAPPGNAPSAVIARIEIDAERADIAAALNDVAALPPAAKPLAAAWVDKAKAREAAIAASRQIAAAALANLSKPASQ